jgi:hypothetical protein
VDVRTYYPRGLKELAVKFGADFDGDVIKYCGNDVLITEELLRKQFMEEKEMITNVTLIGSMKNKEAMMEIYNKLTLRGVTVFLPYMDTISEDADEDTIERLHNLHINKMTESNLVIVVDQDGYIEKDTRAEIKWCEEHGRSIIYASDLGMTQPAKSKK